MYPYGEQKDAGAAAFRARPSVFPTPHGPCSADGLLT